MILNPPPPAGDISAEDFIRDFLGTATGRDAGCIHPALGAGGEDLFPTGEEGWIAVPRRTGVDATDTSGDGDEGWVFLDLAKRRRDQR